MLGKVGSRRAEKLQHPLKPDARTSAIPAGRRERRARRVGREVLTGGRGSVAEHFLEGTDEHGLCRPAFR
jgi:hypothetical protein